MQLPEFPPVSDGILCAIAERHGLGARTFERLPQVGVVHAVYADQELVLRIPRNDPAFTASARNEAIAVPAARKAGVRTPELLVFDDSQTLLPVPYTIYERFQGQNFGQLGLEPTEAPEVWRAVGRDLARLHTGVQAENFGAPIKKRPPLDPIALFEGRARDGYMTNSEARWFTTWLDRLAPIACTPVESRFLHADVQATNILVDEGNNEYVGLLDWGDAKWSDPAFDFSGMPLRAVPYILEGHREVAPLDSDETAEVRILWKQLHLAAAKLGDGPTPGRSWVEHPMTVLIDILRFFQASPSGRWAEIAPPSRL